MSDILEHKCNACSGSGKINAEVNKSQKDSLIEQLVEMMDALVGIEDNQVQLLPHSEIKDISHCCAGELKEVDGAMVVVGDNIVLGKSYELRFNIYHKKGDKDGTN